MKELYTKFQGRGKDSLLHRNLRVCTEEGMFATPFVILTVPGNMIMANLLNSVLGIGPSLYGLIVSLPAWANALQILLIPILARRISARTTTICLSLVNVGIWFLLLFSLRRLPVEDPQLTGQFLVLYFAFISLTQSLAGVGWMSWIQEWIPERLRGKYFGNRNRIMGIITVGFVIGVERTFHYFGESLLAFEIILGVTGLMRLLSIYLLTHIYTPWSEPERMIHDEGKRRFSELLSPGPFRIYLIFAAIQAFLFSVTGPFVPFFMTQHLEFTVSRQTHLLILANLASAIAIPVWGRLFDRHGCRPVIILTGMAWMIQNYLWVILTPELTWLLYLMYLWGGAFSGGVILGGFTLVLKLTPGHLKSTGVSLHLAVTSIAAAFAPILVGIFLATPLLEGMNVEHRYRILFALQPTLVMLSFLMLARVDEPKAAGLSSFSGAFRTMRQVLIQNGILIVGNFTFFRILRKGVISVLDKNKAGDGDSPGL